MNEQSVIVATVDYERRGPIHNDLISSACEDPDRGDGTAGDRWRRPDGTGVMSAEAGRLNPL